MNWSLTFVVCIISLAGSFVFTLGIRCPVYAKRPLLHSDEDLTFCFCESLDRMVLKAWYSRRTFLLGIAPNTFKCLLRSFSNRHQAATKPLQSSIKLLYLHCISGTLGSPWLMFLFYFSSFVLDAGSNFHCLFISNIASGISPIRKEKFFNLKSNFTFKHWCKVYIIKSNNINTLIYIKFYIKYLRTSIRTSEAEIAEKIRTSRLSEKKGVLIKKKRCSENMKIHHPKFRDS